MSPYLQDGPVIAMLIGVLASAVIHLSQGLMKLGIQRIRTPEPVAGLSGRTLHVTGMALNFTAPLWVILANRFAPTPFFTSMYATGLLVLLAFSCYKMGECLRPVQVAGAGVIVAGTLLIAGGEYIAGTPSMASVDPRIVIAVAAGWLLATPVLGWFMLGRRTVARELVFGLAAGGFLALDALLKGLAQADPEGSTFLPQTPAAWGLFAASFVGAAGAFGMMQWGFARGCRASIVAANYNVGYVMVPLLVVPLATTGAGIGWWCVAGVALLALGVMAVQREGAPAQ